MRDVRLKTRGHVTASCLRAILYKQYMEIGSRKDKGEMFTAEEVEQFADTIVDECIRRKKF